MDTQLELLNRERNIYELANLYPQQRKDPKEMLDFLASPEIGNGELKLLGDHFECSKTGNKYPVSDGVVNFTDKPQDNKDRQWHKLNRQFLNYHKSLSAYTLLNSTPFINYVSARSKIGLLQNATVLDAGGGTGHALCSFFRYPETINYILLDPNLRLMHDQFMRIYPLLNELKMTHLLGYAEQLPIKDQSIDVVISISSIDHYKDFRKFISEAFRVLKKGGRLLISSHLDIKAPESEYRKTGLVDYLEKVARFLYYRKYRVGEDDHTYHFKDTKAFEEELGNNNFSIIEKEVFLKYFFIVAKRNS